MEEIVTWKKVQILYYCSENYSTVKNSLVWNITAKNFSSISLQLSLLDTDSQGPDISDYKTWQNI